MKIEGKTRSWILWALRLAGTVLFLGLILRSLDVRELYNHLKALPLWGYLALFGLYLFNQLLTAWRWRVLLAVVGVREPLRALTVAVLYGQTINKILPSSIGGDSARIAYLFKNHPDQKTLTLTATLADRGLAFLALFVLGFLSLPFGVGFPARQRMAGAVLLAGLFLGLITVYWGIWDPVIDKLRRWKRLPGGAKASLARFWKVFLVYRAQKRALLGALGISLLRQGLMILNLFFLFQLLDIPVGLGKLMVVIPLVTILVILPISIGGVGVREAALASFLGVSGESVLSFTLIRYSFIVLVPVILLADTLVFSPRRRRESGS